MKKLTAFFIILVFGYTIYGESPYYLEMKKEILLSGTALGLGTAALITGGKDKLTLEDIENADKSSINGFDRSAVENYSRSADELSDKLLLACMVSPTIFALDKETREDYKILGVMYCETMLLTYGSTQFIKNITDRKRPYIYNEGVENSIKLEDDSAQDSFFSGHTSMAFASAVFTAKVYSDYNPDSNYKPYVWGGMLSIASFTGYQRYRAGKHFPTDIIAGALVGGTIGYVVPSMHKKNSKSLSVLPFVNKNNYGFQFAMEF